MPAQAYAADRALALVAVALHLEQNSSTVDGAPDRDSRPRPRPSPSSITEVQGWRVTGSIIPGEGPGTR
jgi:hypothetical protein